MSKQLVLMVDDELDNRVMMRYFLESWGYEVELAANAKEALAKVAEQRPALVLLDLEMLLALRVLDGVNDVAYFFQQARELHLNDIPDQFQVDAEVLCRDFIWANGDADTVRATSDFNGPRLVS